jgi:hypothetical protein
MNSVLHYTIPLSGSYSKILCFSVRPYRYQACVSDYYCNANTHCLCDFGKKLHQTWRKMCAMSDNWDNKIHM